MLPGKTLEHLDCLGLYFARFHGGEREKLKRVVKCCTPPFKHEHFIQLQP